MQKEKTSGGKGIEAQQECKKSLRQEQIKLDKTSIAAEGCSRCLVDIIPLCRQALQTAGAAQSPSPNLLQHQVPEALLGTGLKVHLQVLAQLGATRKKKCAGDWLIFWPSTRCSRQELRKSPEVQGIAATSFLHNTHHTNLQQSAGGQQSTL